MNHVSFLVSDGIGRRFAADLGLHALSALARRGLCRQGPSAPWDAFSQSVSQLRIAPL